MIARIDAEFETLIPPITGDERERLRASLASEGCRDPIFVWKEPGNRQPVIVDGHNRFRLCAELGIKMPPPREMQFANREAAKTWILANQIARRNLSSDQITLLYVSRGASPPNRPTAQQIADAEIVASDPDYRTRVLRGDPGISLRIAARQIRGKREPRTPRQPTGPRVNPDRGSGGDPAVPVGRVSASHSALSPTDIATARLKAEASRASSDLRILQKRLIEAEKEREFYDAIGSGKPIEVNRSAPKSGKREGTLVTIASDWHVGEVVSREETHGTNHYDLKEARRRAGNFWDNVLWIRKDAQRTITSPDHVLALNGDMISGSIHQELAESNEVGLVEQVGEAIAMLEPGIRELARTTRRLVIPCVHGNHGRFSVGKSLVKIGWAVSLESMLYRWLRDKMRDCENIEWLIPKAESVQTDVMGYRIRWQHGTHIKSQGGIGGILVPLTRWAIRQNTADFYGFGHFHTACTFGKVIVNGSLIGESAYSVELGFEARPPEQVNFVIDAKRGLRRFDQVSVT